MSTELLYTKRGNPITVGIKMVYGELKRARFKSNAHEKASRSINKFEKISRLYLSFSDDFHGFLEDCYEMSDGTATLEKVMKLKQENLPWKEILNEMMEEKPEFVAKLRHHITTEYPDETRFITHCSCGWKKEVKTTPLKKIA